MRSGIKETALHFSWWNYRHINRKSFVAYVKALHVDQVVFYWKSCREAGIPPPTLVITHHSSSFFLIP